MRPRLAILSAILSILVLAAIAIAVSSIPASWPTFRHDTTHTAIADTAGPEKVTLLWNKTTGAIRSSPLIDSSFSGTAIITGADDNKVYAFNKSGESLWTYSAPTTGKFRSSAAIIKSVALEVGGTPQGNIDLIFIGNDDKKLYALRESDGVKMATYTTGTQAMQGAFAGGSVRTSPVVDLQVPFKMEVNQTIPSPETQDGVFFGDLGGFFYAVSASESFNPGPELLLRWVHTTKGPIYSSPALDKGVPLAFKLVEGEPNYFLEREQDPDHIDTLNKIVIYNSVNLLLFGSDDNKLYALGEKTGSKAWVYLAENKIRSSPSVAKNVNFTYRNLTNVVTSRLGNIVAVGADDNRIHGVSEYDGIGVWVFSTGGKVRSSPAAASIGNAPAFIVGSDDGKVYALNASGTGDGGTVKLWEFATSGPVRGSPVIDKDKKNAYVTSCDGNVYGLKLSDGSLLFKKSYNKTGPVTCADDELISSPSLDTNLYFGSPTGFVDAFQPGAPDLTVSDITFSRSSNVIPGDKINITVEIKNNGDAKSDPTTTHLYFTNQSNSIQNFTVTSLTAAESTNFIREHNFTDEGTYSICGYIDPQEKVEEADETNNEKCVALTVGSGVAPTTTTLGVADTTKPQTSNLVQTPESPKVGDTITISGTATDDVALGTAVMQFQENGAWVDKGTQTLSGKSGNFSFTLGTSGVAGGTKITWRVVLRDAKGNVLETESKIFTVEAGACKSTAPSAFNKTQCGAVGTLVQVDYVCNQVSGAWEPKESEVICTAPPQQKSPDYTIWIIFVVGILVIAGAVYYFMKMKKQPAAEKIEEEPAAAPEEQQPEGEPPQ